MVWILHSGAFKNGAEDSDLDLCLFLGLFLALGIGSSARGRRRLGVETADANFNFSSESSATSVEPSDVTRLQGVGGERKGVPGLAGVASERVYAKFDRTSVELVGGVIGTSTNEPLDDSRRAFSFVESSVLGVSEVAGVSSAVILMVIEVDELSVD